MVRYKIFQLYNNGNLKPLKNEVNKYYKNLPYWKLMSYSSKQNTILIMYNENIYNNGQLEYINHYDFNKYNNYIFSKLMSDNYHLKAIKLLLKDFDKKLLFGYLSDISSIKHIIYNNNNFKINGTVVSKNTCKQIESIIFKTKDKDIILNFRDLNDLKQLFKIKVW